MEEIINLKKIQTKSGKGEFSEIISEALQKGVKRLITHEKPDLDAIASLWFTIRVLLGISREQKRPEIMFVPAGWKGVLEPGDLALDISVDGQGVKGSFWSKDQKVHSCLLELFNFCDNKEAKKIMRDLVLLLDLHDSSGFGATKDRSGRGENSAWPRFAGLFFSWQYQLLVKPNDHLAICERIFEDLDGYYILVDEFVNKKFRARVISSTTVIGKTALYINNSGQEEFFSASSIIFDNLKMPCYVYVDGFNLGILLNGEEVGGKFRADHEEIKKVISNAGEAEGWFSHNGGTMYSWGTKKSHASKASKVDPLILATAVEAVRKMYCEM
jgi:hypothetical protein